MNLIELNGELVLVAVVNHETNELPAESRVNRMVSARVGESVFQYLGEDPQPAVNWAAAKLAQLAPHFPDMNVPNGIDLTLNHESGSAPVKRVILVIVSTFAQAHEIDWNHAFSAITQNIQVTAPDQAAVAPVNADAAASAPQAAEVAQGATA